VGNLTYVVRAQNFGDAEATGLEVSVELTLPPGVTVASVTPYNGTWSNSFPGTFDIADLPAPFTVDGVDFIGGYATLTIALTVSGAAGAATDAITIEAHVSALEEDDSETNNDFATEHTSIRTQANFQVSKDFSDDSTAGVTVQLSCSGGQVDPPIVVTEGPLGGLGVVEFPAGTSCTVTETVPAGYSASYAPGCTIDPIVSNLGNYPCLITNTQSPVQLVVNKTFTDGNTADVTIDLDCGAGTVTADDPTASSSDPAEFTISNFPVAGTTCTATEALPAGYAQKSSTCTDVDVTVGGTPSCEFVNVPMRATFAVTKEFTDGDNPTEVEVTINCFTGLPIEQSQTIDENHGVEFVVTSFDTGELDCEITEEALLGYTPTYQPGGPGTFDADGGCNFDAVEGGTENTCHIVNDADPVPVEIVKDWIIDGSGGDQVSQQFDLTLYCDAEIVGGETGTHNAYGGCGGNPALTAIRGIGQSYESCLKLEGVGDTTFTPEVIPEWPGSHCWVDETVYDDAAEVDNECGNIVISAGHGDSCVITNTVFFEGIPTLSQWGRMLMILLVLGVGIIAYRRIA